MKSAYLTSAQIELTLGTILNWMDDKEAAQNVDMGIGGVDIPNHVQYWRSVEANALLDI